MPFTMDDYNSNKKPAEITQEHTEESLKKWMIPASKQPKSMSGVYGLAFNILGPLHEGVDGFFTYGGSLKVGTRRDENEMIGTAKVIALNHHFNESINNWEILTPKSLTESYKDIIAEINKDLPDNEKITEVEAAFVKITNDRDNFASVMMDVRRKMKHHTQMHAYVRLYSAWLEQYPSTRINPETGDEEAFLRVALNLQVNLVDFVAYKTNEKGVIDTRVIENEKYLSHVHGVSIEDFKSKLDHNEIFNRTRFHRYTARQMAKTEKPEMTLKSQTAAQRAADTEDVLEPKGTSTKSEVKRIVERD